MNEQQAKQAATNYIQKIHDAVHRTFAPQLEKHKQFLGQKLRESVILAGALTSLTITLFSSNTPIFKPLTALGLVLFAIVFIVAIVIFFESVQMLAKYSLKIKEISTLLVDFSGVCVKFNNGDMTLEEFLKRESKVRALYPSMRDNEAFDAVEVWDKEFLQKLADGDYSQINVIILCLIGGVVSVVLSILLPLFLC